MADSIGKIVVSIEAEVAELRKGLTQAEAEFKKTVARLEGQQAKLGKSFKQSWVELSSKVSVYTTAARVATSAMRGLKDAMVVWGEEGSSAAGKVGGSILAFGNAGIPIISDLIKTAEGLAGLFIDVAGAEREAAEAQRQLAITSREINQIMGDKSVVTSMERRLEVQKQLTRIASLEVLPTRSSKIESAQRRRAIQRLQLETQLQKQIASMTRDLEREAAEDAARETLRFFDYETLQKENRLAISLEKQATIERKAREEKAEADKREADRKAENDIRDAKLIVDKTLDLETQLNIMLAKQAGDEEKARMLAIESRYRKMKENATEAQSDIIEQMRLIEIGTSGGSGSNVGGGGTASISTAVGGFTVASGDIETKKQTGLLQRIADSNEKVAHAITTGGGNNSIIPAQA